MYDNCKLKEKFKYEGMKLLIHIAALLKSALILGKKKWCCVCSAINKEIRTKFRHLKCSVELCVSYCFRLQHRKL